MKNSAILINIGRGGHIVESDLIEAIEQQEILGAALDVVENEPISDDHPFLKWIKLSLCHTSAVVQLQREIKWCNYA